LGNLKPLHGSLKFIERTFTNEYLRVYLTHRSYTSIFTTIKWLAQKAELKPGNLVCFVQQPQQKLVFFEAAEKSKKFTEIAIMDDFSHSHETGAPIFYQDILNIINAKTYRYIGYNQILALN
jgi:hypothetical protein